MTSDAKKAFLKAYFIAQELRHEFVTPEHLLLSFVQQETFIAALYECNTNTEQLRNILVDHINSMEKVPEDIEYELTNSAQLNTLLEEADYKRRQEHQREMNVPLLTLALFELHESWANYILTQQLKVDPLYFAAVVEDFYNRHQEQETQQKEKTQPKTETAEDGEKENSCIVCLNDVAEKKNPLIGRTFELERTMEVLCRKEKNNVLHIGEPGVGKTSIVYGLARKLNQKDVPAQLADFKIYNLDVSGLLAGTQYRGELEKRIKLTMDSIAQKGKAIVYIDEIHNIVGAGKTSGSSLDASSMLKPYLDNENIRFMGSTTYDDYKKTIANDKALNRRFQMIDINEPSVEECIDILQGVKSAYEQFHHLTYTDEAIAFAVKGSDRYLNDRFLPDKAIDLIDEAGAYHNLHPTDSNTVVDKKLVAMVLGRMCRTTIKEEDDATNNNPYKNLEQDIKTLVFGQDEAVKQVTEAVMMAQAGLQDADKTMANLLFVGPTGVGKTEIAKVLAQKLHIPLVRFDMSEYSDKLNTTKLIGSSAGYVGYDEGGLLTNAIRKSPNCVLLLDEIEKAHSEVFNLLLQVMDYATLTDNKGMKADFRHVILIMTSNAGAQFAEQAKVGFASTVTTNDTLMKKVKSTFSPEFINRLTSIVCFNPMSEDMAQRILGKKTAAIQKQLHEKDVNFELDEKAVKWLLGRGYNKQYGGREVDRILSQHLKLTLAKAIMTGELKKGFTALITVNETEDQLAIESLTPWQHENTKSTEE